MTSAAFGSPAPPVKERRPHSSPEERALVVKWYREGDSSSEIAAHFGRSKQWVLNVVRASGDVKPAEEAQHPGRRRRRDLIAEVVRRLQAGETQRAIGRALGFAVPALIWQVRNGVVNAPELLAVVGEARPCWRGAARRKSC